jgi:hypothetical protein
MGFPGAGASDQFSRTGAPSKKNHRCCRAGIGGAHCTPPGPAALADSKELGDKRVTELGPREPQKAPVSSPPSGLSG